MCTLSEINLNLHRMLSQVSLTAENVFFVFYESGETNKTVFSHLTHTCRLFHLCCVVVGNDIWGKTMHELPSQKSNLHESLCIIMKTAYEITLYQ